jgi:hypothetical protein
VARIRYKTWNPGTSTQRAIANANRVCADFMAQGYDLTLRQVYYQFVSHDLFPDDRTWTWTGVKWVRDPNGSKNADPNYKWLGEIVNDARLAGMLDWDYIVDRARNLYAHSHWGSPGDIIRSAANGFALDKWNDQDCRVEVWVEKDALSGIIGRAADAYDCAWFACKGYVSQSEMWGAAQRIRRYIAGGQNVVILHLGDHDPSGIDMTRDIRERITDFLHQDWLNDHMPDVSTAGWSEVEESMCEGLRKDDVRYPFLVDRIALNWDQIEEYSPPPNPAKLTDSRSKTYVEQYGYESWELDALDPPVLAGLIRDHIERWVDMGRYGDRETLEDEHRRFLQGASNRWADVMTYLDTPEVTYEHLSH